MNNSNFGTCVYSACTLSCSFLLRINLILLIDLLIISPIVCFLKTWNDSTKIIDNKITYKQFSPSKEV